MPTTNKGDREPLQAKKYDSAGETLEGETLQNVNRVVEIERSQREARTRGERVAALVSAFCGSIIFVWVHVFWFASWIFLNSVLVNLAFDPFPYTFLTLVVSLAAIFLSTFILISQNQETQLTERRKHLDLQINLLAEQENTKMLQLLIAISEKVGV